MPDGVCSIDATRSTCDDRDDDHLVCRDPDAERRQLDAAARARAEEHASSSDVYIDLTPAYVLGPPLASPVTAAPPHATAATFNPNALQGQHLYSTLDALQRAWTAAPRESQERAILQAQINTLSRAAYDRQATASATPGVTAASSMTSSQIADEIKQRESQVATFQQFTPADVVARLDELRRAQHGAWSAPAIARPPMGDLREIRNAKDAAFLAQSEQTFLAAYGDALPPHERAQRQEYLDGLHAKWQDLHGHEQSCREARPTLVQENQLPKTGSFTARDWVDSIERDAGVRLGVEEVKQLHAAFAQWRQTQCWDTGVDPGRFADVNAYRTADVDKLAIAREDMDKRMQVIEMIRGNPLASLSMVASIVHNDSIDRALVRMGGIDNLSTLLQTAPWGLPRVSEQVRVVGPMQNGRTLDENAHVYGDLWRSGKRWGWEQDFPGGPTFTDGQRGAIRQEAIRRGYMLGGITGVALATSARRPELPTQLESASPGLDSSAAIAQLRRQTPNAKLQQAVNAQSTPKFDPVYGVEVDNYEADHIVPFKTIVSMPGFDRLTPDAQREVVNLRENIMGLGKASNASKGARSWSDWPGHSELGPVPPLIRDEMLGHEADAMLALRRAIEERGPK